MSSSEFNLFTAELSFAANNTATLLTELGNFSLRSAKIYIVVGKPDVQILVDTQHGPLPAMPQKVQLLLPFEGFPIPLSMCQEKGSLNTVSPSLSRFELKAADQNANERMIKLIQSLAARLG